MFKSIVDSYHGKFAEVEKLLYELRNILPETSNPQLAELVLQHHTSYVMLHLKRIEEAESAMADVRRQIHNFPMCREKIEIMCGICIFDLETCTSSITTEAINHIIKQLQDIKTAYWNVENEMDPHEYTCQQIYADVMRCFVKMKITVQGNDLTDSNISVSDMKQCQNDLDAFGKKGALQKLGRKWRIISDMTRAKIAILQNNTPEVKKYLIHAYKEAEIMQHLPFLKKNVRKFIEYYWKYDVNPLGKIFTQREFPFMQKLPDSMCIQVSVKNIYLFYYFFLNNKIKKN